MVALALGLAPSAVAFPRAGVVPEPAAVRVLRVGRERQLAAMRAEVALGYDVTRTTNAGRFQASVYVRLLQQARAAGVGEAVLFLQHDDWYEAYRQAASLAQEEVPEFVRLSWQNLQDGFLDAREGRVIREVNKGDPPELAANVRLSWQQSDNPAEAMLLEDHESVPEVLVRTGRVVTFRLLRFGDVLRFEQVEGTKVRPLTGALAFLFRIIGLARVQRVAMAVAPDGVTVGRASAKKAFIHASATVTVLPDGTADKGLPDGRPDLEAIEQRLRDWPEIEYVDTDWEPILRAAYDGPGPPVWR